MYHLRVVRLGSEGLLTAVSRPAEPSRNLLEAICSHLLSSLL